MATYAIGDIQGCYDSLVKLLDQINFNEKSDTLWFAGDIVNRGPKSLETLRFINNLPNKRIVLGNHDIHLIALAYGHPFEGKHTMQDILKAPDKEELIEWLCQQPLAYYDKELDFLMVHAGVIPQWNITDILNHSKEFETLLLQPKLRSELCIKLYGDEPSTWSDKLSGWERIRFIVNVLTRIRYCYSDGRLELNHKGPIGTQPTNSLPWFYLDNRKTKNNNIIFGHWASLEGKANTPNIFALDTGCLWGGKLTALRLEDKKLFSCNCA